MREPFQVSVTWGHINPKPGFVSAWDSAKTSYDSTHGVGAFDLLPRTDFGAARPSQNQSVREYINSL